jgi:glycosyltransferase involved in cell wall biosynthesis
MQKLLCVVPHLSTGGCPQFLVKKIELLRDNYDIHVIEWENFTGGKLVVQRNRILDLIPDFNFYSIHGDGNVLLNIINNIKPDVIHFEELPETFLASNFLEKIYSKDRKYKIIETTHDSSFPTTIKQFLPDSYFFVSAYNAFKYINSDIPYEVIEYPIEQKIPNREEARKKLGFEDDWKHVINVGLFTPRKNQKYLFEIAEKLKEYKIKFHFIGNQADNFKFYWEPLMQNVPNNCKVWGERSDVEDFIQAADLSFFASKGDKNNKELNPIAIKEVLEYNIPMMLFNLDVYCGKYNNNPNIHFLTGDLDKDTQLLIKFFELEKQHILDEEVIIISTYPDTQARKQLTKECIESFKKTGRKILLVSHYPVTEEIQKLVDYYFFDINNVMIHHSFYNRFFNYTDDYNVEINISALAKSNQSFAAYVNLYNGFKLAQQLGFTKVLFVVYDVVLHEADLDAVENIFKKISDPDWHAYLTRIHTDVGMGIETTAMGFKIDYFLKTFPYIINPNEFILDCERRGSHNFLEHYFMAILRDEMGLWIEYGSTIVPNSGLGRSSTSEYMSILPIEGREGEFMFYFYTYNVDDRSIQLRVYEEEEEITNITQQISQNRELCKEIIYSGKPLKIIFDRIDKEEIYKSQTFHINETNIHEYNHNGIFRVTKRPKIKLIHLQTTNNDGREQSSRDNLSQIGKHGVEYKLIQNEPYKELPPTETCLRPDCVSMTRFEEGHPLHGQALTPPHYGCFESFKNGILNEFDEDLDFLIVCEGDCLLEVLPTTFLDTVYKVCDTINKNKIDYFSFGDTHTLEEGWFVSPIIEEISGQDLLFITNKIIGIQCIMFPKHIREFLFEKLKTHPWEAADLYFNIIFADKKMGILKKRITTQVDGYSLIDRSLKTFRK